jgi:hypothetical protein
VVSCAAAAAPMRAPGVKRVHEASPATVWVSLGMGGCLSCWVVPRSRPVTQPCGRGPVGAPAAREERAGRTYELDADERRLIMAGRGRPRRFCVGGWVARFPGVVRLSEWSHKHPFGCGPGLARRHDRVSGTGLLSQMIERGWWPAHAAGASVRGLVTLPVCG